MRILKFGGTSVAGAERLRQVAGIVASAANRDEVAVVVSAQAGVTDALVAAADRGRSAGLVDELERRHLRGLEVLGGPGAAAAASAVRDRLSGLAALLDGEPANGDRPAWRDAVLATGERLSVHLAAAALAAAGLCTRVVDASELVVTDTSFGHASVDAKATRERVRAFRSTWPQGTVPVVTGFIGADPAGQTTTLGRGGSDTSAAVLGAALGAERIEIWTDVEGVLSASPRIVPEAIPLQALSFGVAREVALLGGKVLHPGTMAPAEAAGIPIVVRNTFAPGRPGTVVGPAGRRTARARVVTGLDGVTLLSARIAAEHNASTAWAPLVARLQQSGITVLGLDLANPTLARVAVPAGEAGWAAGLLAPTTGRARIEQRDDLCLVAVVGDGVAAGHPGEAGLRDLLDRLHLPALAVLRRSSPDTVVALLRSHFLHRAITALHEVVVLGSHEKQQQRYDLRPGIHLWGTTGLAWQGGRP